TDAIGEANRTIYNYAREHPEMTGMGTTCVALVVHGGRAYVVNIGDSRAYIVREGKMRQMTLDHSWVAEQVRAGIISETQARTHAPETFLPRGGGRATGVRGVLFMETLRGGGGFLLGGAGLRGLGEEQAMEQQWVEHPDPGGVVRPLFDRPNDTGGPKNIPAI